MAGKIVTRGSVVLIRYPFTDLSGSKVRPAIILTPNNLLNQIEDVHCLFISSVVPSNLLPTDYILETSHAAFPQTGLKFRSLLRAHKKALLHKSLVLRVLGMLGDELMREVDTRLRMALGI